ncbi:MAG: hypothetical protein JNK40_12860 [Chromatiales bacterium]|nr:hypothetical protein [Chromatiales bacterium]
MKVAPRLLVTLVILVGSLGAPGRAAADPAALDFAARCAAAGVVKCVGFDSRDDFAGGQVNPAADGRIRATMDRQVVASGEGSLRFEIPSRSPPNSSGYWLDSLGARFGEKSTFHFQFRQRFSPEFLATRYSQPAGWKQFIVYHSGPSCTSVQLVLINQYLRGLPTMYAACGQDNLYVLRPDGDHFIQQGDYRCSRRDPRPGSCARYVANEWMTFSFRVDVGDFGKPNTRVQGWIGYGPGPVRQFIDFPDLTLNYADSPAEGFSQIQFTPYQTDKDPAQEHPVAFTWYDELIVSRQAIAAPGRSEGRGDAR